MLERPSKLTSYRFDQLADQINQRVMPAEADAERYVGLEHLDPDSLRIRRWGDPSEVESTKLRFEPGDIIFGKRRVYQRKVAVADTDGICSAHAMVLRAKPDTVLPEFLPFFMQSDLFMERALSISVGSLSPTINWKALAKEEFLLPPIQEQARLVDAFAATSAQAERLEEALISLDRLRLSLIFDFETQVVAKQKISTVVDHIEVGKSPKSNGEVAREGELAVLKVSAVGDWRFVASENKVIAPADFVEAAEVHDGDFLVTRANADPDSVARSCIVEVAPPGLMLSDKTWRVVLRKEAEPFAYAVLAWTKSRSFRKHIRNQLNGTDAKNISQRAFLAGPFPNDLGGLSDFDKQIRQLTNERKSLLARIDMARAYHSALVQEATTQ